MKFSYKSVKRTESWPNGSWSSDYYIKFRAKCSCGNKIKGYFPFDKEDVEFVCGKCETTIKIQITRKD